MAGALPEKVGQIYYSYGLICSSYPFIIISIAVSILVICCLPLLNMPLPGNQPTVLNMPVDFKHIQSKMKEDENYFFGPDQLFDLSMASNETYKFQHIWAKEKPFLYVQQIIMKIGVFPWNNNMRLWDAFRAPIQEVFRLIEIIRNHQDEKTKNTLSQLCYQVENINNWADGETHLSIFPEYSCLLLSPANLWEQNLHLFSSDTNIINSVYKFQNTLKSKTSVAEMAFGLLLRDSGIKRYPLRVRPRVLQYAVTIFFKDAELSYLTSLKSKLQLNYPLHQSSMDNYNNEVTVIYYPSYFNYGELIPLLITFMGIFFYVYFSVRKIPLIKSKFGLAASAVLAIISNLLMSIGICFHFGFSLNLQGKEVLPYLIVIVGLENTLVITKSVTSTDSKLDVKIRLAQGLSKEGWSITKNLLIEITIFTVGFFTFVPFIQEFSIFMIVSLLADYCIQLTFFASILGVNVEGMDNQDEKLQINDFFCCNSGLKWRHNLDDEYYPSRMTKSTSHPKLSNLSDNTDVVANSQLKMKNKEHRVPKRIRLVNIWARTRFFQRAFMIWMVVWLSSIVYNSGLIDYLVNNDTVNSKSGVHKKDMKSQKTPKDFYKSYNKSTLVFSPLLDFQNKDVDTNETLLLKHSRFISRLSPYHWPAILAQYNESAAGRYIVLLPPVLLSHRVSPEAAAGVRNPDEKDPPPLRWRALAAALDPIDILNELDMPESKRQDLWGKPSELPIYPTTPMEILLLSVLCVISVAVIAYMMFVLYR